MKIGIIGTHGYPYVYGGYETFVKELAERLVKENINVTIYCRKNYFDKYPKIINGINLIYIPTIKHKIYAQFIHSLLSIIHACLKRYDIILVVNPANGPFGIFPKLFKIKSLINVDGLEWLRPKWRGLGSKYFYYSSKLATKLYDIIINDSIEMSRIYKKIFNTDSVVIEYGANIITQHNTKLIEKWNLKKNEYYLIVGRLIPDNNSCIIVNNFIRSVSKKKLVVVGDVPYKDKYAERVKLIKDYRLMFTGYITNQDELSELYNNCFIYFHGHEFGGTNPAMLQALANGCAIVALDTPFNREMLDNGKYGMFFKKNEWELTELINNIEENENIIQKYRILSPEIIKLKYNWERITTEYIKLFEKVLNNNY